MNTMEATECSCKGEPELPETTQSFRDARVIGYLLRKAAKGV